MVKCCVKISKNKRTKIAWAILKQIPNIPSCIHLCSCLAGLQLDLDSPPPTSLAFEKPFFISREWPILEMKCPLAGLELSAFCLANIPT